MNSQNANFSILLLANRKARLPKPHPARKHKFTGTKRKCSQSGFSGGALSKESQNSMKEPAPPPGEGPKKSSVDQIDTALVENLAEIATRLGLSEIEVQHGDLKIRVSRQAGFIASPSAVQSSRVAEETSPARPRGLESKPEQYPGTVKSPMVGTVYLRPSPDTPAFIEIGALVKAGDKLLLIEAMKTFNEIIAPASGTVTKILIEDGQPVEFGQPLLIIE
jgi:acetyl-CoA carboxylase biotin carboxyl carrier protein